MTRTVFLLAFIALPLRNLQVTSAFGNRVHPLTGNYSHHFGVDLRAGYDTVFAVVSSHVFAIGYDPLLGVYIKIKKGPFTFTYGHLDECFIKLGDSVSVSQPIGISGESGRVTGPHLHFAVQFNHRYINPLAFLSAAYQRISNP